MDKFTSRNFKILMVTVVVLLGILVYSLNAGSDIFSDALGVVSSPLLQVGSTTTQSAKAFVNLDGLSHEELKTLYNQLLEENRALREQLVDYFDMKEENASYENILEIKTTIPQLQMVAASVVGRDPGDVFYDFTIDCGAMSGVSAGDAVITEMGVVGVVQEVYATSSRVRSIFSEDTRIGVVAKECSESGVISCDLQFANSGKVKMLYLTRDTQVQPGTIITTSGIGGAFPANLLVGRVDSVERSSMDASFYAVVSPYAAVQTVTEVFVVTDFEGKGDVETNMPQRDEEDPTLATGRGEAAGG